MTTLKQLSKKLSQYIFESVGDIRGYPDLDLVKIEDVKEWLMQKRQEYQKDVDIVYNANRCITTTVEYYQGKVKVIDELLEELAQ